MPTPPNLVTSHVNDVGEFINAGDIDDLATAVNGMPVVLAPVGADATGVADSAPAINAAIAALPANYGTVQLPPGTFKINSTLNLGNGTSSAWSTRNGMILRGAAPGANGWGILGGAGAPNQATYGATRLVAGTVGMTMIKVNGPLFSWGIQDLFLDGNNGTAAVGIAEQACCGGDTRNVAVVNCSNTAWFCYSVSATGTFAGMAVNHARNYYRNNLIWIPAGSSSNGLWIDGNGVDDSSDSWGDVWEMLKIGFQSVPAANSGIYAKGLTLAACDSITLRDVVFQHADVVTGAGNFALLPHYDNPNTPNGWGTQWPANCTLEHVDFGSSTATFSQSGLPGGAFPNRIVDIRNLNGRPPNPNLIGLAWGYSNASP